MRPLKEINWTRIFMFYGIVLLATYFARQLPNFIQIFFKHCFNLNVTLNYNHGIAIALVSLIFYQFSTIKRTFSLLGSCKKSFIFPSLMLMSYSVYGIKNDFGMDKHLWAFIFCLLTLLYNLMEEFTWRGYVIESLGGVNLLLKGAISGFFWAIWHLFIFSDFKQYGGFAIFLVFCIVFSIILTYSVTKTKSILIPATIHTTLIRTNFVTAILFFVYGIILFTWKRMWYRK